MPCGVKVKSDQVSLECLAEDRVILGWSGYRRWMDVNEVRCSVLDTIGWESSQEGVAVNQAGDDQCLDQDLSCVFCEERPDPADVLEGRFAGSGHSSDVGGAGQSEDYVQVPHRWWRRFHDILNSDWHVHVRPVFSRDEEEFRFTKAEFEVMSSCPSRDDADIQRWASQLGC